MNILSKIRDYIWSSDAEDPGKEESNRTIAETLPSYPVTEILKYDNERAAYRAMADRVGALWKLTNGKKSKYILAKTGIVGRSFIEIPYEQLYQEARYLAFSDRSPLEEKNFQRCRNKTLSPKRLALLLSGALVASLGGKNLGEEWIQPIAPSSGSIIPLFQGGVSYTLFMQSGHPQPHSLAAISLAISSLPFVYGENSPPVVKENAFPNLSLRIGESFEIKDIQEGFSDANLDTLTISIESPASFLEWNKRNHTLLAHIPSWLGPTEIQVVNYTMYLFNDSQGKGLGAFNVSDPRSPQFIATLTSSAAYQGSIRDDYAFVNIKSNLQVFHLTTTESLQVGSYDFGLPGGNSEFALQKGSHVAWLTRGDMFLSVNISDPMHLVEISRFNNTFIPSGIYVTEENVVFLCDRVNNRGCRVLNGEDPENLVDLGTIFDGEDVYSLAIRDRTMVKGEMFQLCLYEISMLANPLFLNQCFTSFQHVSKISGENLYCFFNEVASYFLIKNRFENATHFVFDEKIPIDFGTGSITDLFVNQNRLYMASQAGGVYIFDVDSVDVTLFPQQGDEGVYPIRVVATDNVSGSTNYTFWVRVEGNSATSTLPVATNDGEIPTSTYFVDRSTPSNALLGIAIGGSAMLCIGISIGAALVLLIVRRRKREDLESRLQEESLLERQRENIKEYFGENHYGWFASILMELDRLYLETGFFSRDPFFLDRGVLGQGCFGEIKLCWKVKTGEYYVAKVIEDESKKEESEDEARLQRKAKGLGVWPITNTIQDASGWYHLMPLAGLGTLDDLRKRIVICQEEKNIVTYAEIIGAQILPGLLRTHQFHVYHNDLKGNNILVGNKGNVGITDFGKACESSTGEVDGMLVTCVYYLSPERMRAQIGQASSFSGEKNDAWAIGCLFLEFLTGKRVRHIFNMSLDENFGDPTNMEMYIGSIEKKLDRFVSLQNPVKGSIWWVVKGLLKVNPEERLTILEACEQSCFAKDVSSFAPLFEQLLSKSQEEEKGTEKKETTYQGIASYRHLEEQEDYREVGNDRSIRNRDRENDSYQQVIPDLDGYRGIP